MLVAIQFITALAALLSSLIALFGLLQSRKNGSGIEQVHKATNSMKDALVEATARDSYRAGVKHGEDNPR